RGNLAGRDFDVLTRLRVAPPPGCPLAHFKGAETNDLHPITAGQRLGDGFKQRVHGAPRVLLGEAGFGRDPIDQVRLGQALHLPSRLPRAASIWNYRLSLSCSHHEQHSKKTPGACPPLVSLRQGPFLPAFAEKPRVFLCPVRLLRFPPHRLRRGFYKMKQISPPLPSLMILVSVSCSFFCAWGGMRCSLLWIPSRTRSCRDLPKKSEFHTLPGSFSNSSVR